MTEAIYLEVSEKTEAAKKAGRRVSVCLKIIFKESDKHSRRSDYCIIKCMCKVVSVFTLNSDFKSACLCVSKI